MPMVGQLGLHKSRTVGKGVVGASVLVDSVPIHVRTARAVDRRVVRISKARVERARGIRVGRLDTWEVKTLADN